MVALDDFTNEVLSDCPHTPQILIDKAILRTAQDFYTRTRTWVVDATNISVTPGISTYIIDVPTQYESTGNIVSNIILGIDSITTITKAPVPSPFRYKEGTIVFDDSPTYSDTLVLAVQLKPTLNSFVLPDSSWEYYSEAIIAGSKYYLQRMKGKEWSDIMAARENLLIFNQQIVRSRINKNSEFGYKQLSHRPSNLGWE